jgi:hypothetical protein
MSETSGTESGPGAAEGARQAVTFDPRDFIRELLAMEWPDGGDVQDLAEKYGILECRPLTAEQIADPKGPWHEYGAQQGDGWSDRTPAFTAWLDGDG